MPITTPIVADLCYVRNTGEVLSDPAANGKERPWVPKKEAVEVMSELLEIAYKNDKTVISPAMLLKVKHCGEFLIFKQCPNHSSEKRLISADFCRHRLCPMCNWRKSLKMFSQMSQLVERMTDTNSELRFLFLTLTVKNCTGDKLSETLDHMNKALKLLTDKSKTLAASKCIKQYILGYFKSLEITYKVKSDTFHPHFHLLLAVPESYFVQGFVKTSKWADIWQQCLGVDYTPVVDVRSVDMAQKGVICEITKYAVKGEYLLKGVSKKRGAAAVATLAKSLKNRRLVGFSGIFNRVRKELKQDDIESGDLINISGEEKGDICKVCGTKMLDHMYTWKFGVYVN